MQAVVAVLFCAVALASASTCGPLERLKVKNQWVEAYGTGLNRERLGLDAFNAFFEVEGGTRESLFKRVRGDNVNSAQFRAHMVRVLGGLDMTVSLLDDEKTLNAQLAHLKAQHDARENMDNKYFDEFGTALLNSMQSRLGRHFDRDAFKACYNVITAGIKK